VSFKGLVQGKHQEGKGMITIDERNLGRAHRSRKKENHLAKSDS